MGRLARLSEKQIREFAKEIAWDITHEIEPKLEYKGREYFETESVFIDHCGREWYAYIGYDHNTQNDPGDYWVAPCQDTDSTTTVDVRDARGNDRPDIAKELEEWLN